MRKTLCSLVAAIFVVSCGTKDKDESSQRVDPGLKQDQEDEDAKYFQLMENCNTNTGKAVIDGKCVTLKITVTLNGDLTLSSAESGKAIFEGGIGVKPNHSLPYIKYKRKNTNNNYSYSIKMQSSKLDERSIALDTTLEASNEVSSMLSVLADRSEARVELEIFGERFSSEEQDRSHLEQVCGRIGKVFKDKHLLANSRSTYGLMGTSDSPLCLVGNRRDTIDGLEDFKRIKMWWKCKGDRCYFESLYLNGF